MHKPKRYSCAYCGQRVRVRHSRSTDNLLPVMHRNATTKAYCSGWAAPAVEVDE